MRYILNITPHDRCVSRGGHTVWPPRSPDLNPLDFYLWEQPVTLLCMQLLLTTKRHITLWMPVKLSATTPASLHGCGGPWWDVSRRALNLMEGILSAYYKCALSAITHELNVLGTYFLVSVYGNRSRNFSARLGFTLYKEKIRKLPRYFARIFFLPLAFCRPQVTHSWSWALLEKLKIVQPLKNFPAFYRTRRFITVFTRALHWSISWAWSIQSIPFHPISLRSTLILFTHLRLCLPNDLLPSGSPTNILYAFSFPIRATCPAHLILLPITIT
jgi:hypothetical protein